MSIVSNELLLISLLAMLFVGEESPSLECVFFVTIVYVYLINKSYKESINFGQIFTAVTIIKLLIAALLSYFAWIQPLSELGKLRIPDQIGGGFLDANYYDYLAYELALNNFSNAQDYLLATWQSFGIVLYNGLIYYLFGLHEVNIFLINTAISSILDYLIIKLLIKKVKPFLFFLIPLFLYVMFYSLSPGKEAISNLFFFASIYATYTIIYGDNKSIKIYFIKVIVMIVLGCMRVNLFFLICIIDFFIILKFTKKYRIHFISSTILLIGLLSIITYVIYGERILFEIFDVDKYLSSQRQFLINKSGIIFFFSDLLMPSSTIFYFILAPLRAIAWIIGPFPVLDFSVISCSYDVCSFYDFFRSSESFFRSVSSIMNLIFIFFIFKNWNKVKAVKVQEIWNIFFPAFVIATLIISTFTFLEGAKYRVILEPILYILFCISFKTKMS